MVIVVQLLGKCMVIGHLDSEVTAKGASLNRVLDLRNSQRHTRKLNNYW